ncbi:hypothetical protein FSP39_025348 [Pinctada imbricata]|uniref:Gustatory receptor n=1 Tax=Pinctada imbricata TaxID=66713 RepID=A0AA88Y9P7_PINIB|nr:hypothetical protein FSP39_025348 [Pinctada imbricata]
MPNIVVPFIENSDDFVNPTRKSAWMEEKGLKGTIKPLLWCLKATGLLHDVELRTRRNDDVEGESVGIEEAKRSRCSWYLSYSIFVTLLLWGNFGNSLTVFKGATSFDGLVCNQIITSTWFLQVALFALNNNIGCRHWYGVFQKWDILAKNLEFEKDKSMRRCAVFTSVLYVTWIITSLLFTSIGSLFISGNFAVFSGEASGIIIWIVFLVIYFFFSSAWFLLTASFTVTSFAVYVAFRKFNKRFNEAISADGKFTGDIEENRHQHEELVQLLRKADDIFSLYILVAIGTIIPLIIFTLYFVLFESVDLYSYVATWWSVSLSMIQITVVFVSGGIVNHVAHGPLGTIYTIDLRAMAIEQSQQLSVFLTQLTSAPIGFTAFGLFTIDKPTIITFAGSIVTYAVVVIQFKPSSDSTSVLQQVVANITA